MTAPDPVGALRWRSRTAFVNGLHYSWRTGQLQIMLFTMGAMGLFLGALNFQARGDLWLVTPPGLEAICLLEMFVGALIGVGTGTSVISRRWDDILLPIDWESLVRAKLRFSFPIILALSLSVAALVAAEVVPTSYPIAADVWLYLVEVWVLLASALASFYLVLSLHVGLSGLPRALAKNLSRGLVIGGTAAGYLGVMVLTFGFLNNWPEVTLPLAAITHAPVDLLLGRTPTALDLPGAVCSLVVPAALFLYVRGRPIVLQLPDTVFLASEARGALSPERPPKPGLWTNLRLRFRARYRDWGSGSRALGALMFTLALRAGIALIVVGGLLMAGTLAVLVLLSSGDLAEAAGFFGGIMVLMGALFGTFLGFQMTLPGSPGAYSTARLLPYGSTEYVRQHGRIVWPVQLGVAAAVAGFFYLYFGGPIAALVFGTVLSVELLVTWGSQSSMLSSTSRPHGRGLTTSRLQTAVTLGFAFALAPAEGYVAFTLVAPSDLLLSLDMLGIFAINLALVAALTYSMIRSYVNPPYSGPGTGTPPTR